MNNDLLEYYDQHFLLAISQDRWGCVATVRVRKPLEKSLIVELEIHCMNWSRMEHLGGAKIFAGQLEIMAGDAGKGGAGVRLPSAMKLKRLQDFYYRVRRLDDPSKEVG